MWTVEPGFHRERMHHRKKNNAVEYIKKSGTCSSRQCTHSVWWRNKGGKSQADIAFEKGYVNFESPD